MSERFFFVIPISYDNPASFWSRDSALIVLGLRKLGHEAFLVALNPKHDPLPDQTRPVITCTLGQMADPAWWKALNPYAIVFNLWSAPRFDSIRKAALTATPRVIERLDASGVRVPRIWPSYYFVQTWGAFRDKGWSPFLSFAPALVKTLLFYFFPSLMERPMAMTMAQLPFVVAESPLAAARVDRHIRWYAQGPVKVAQIPNPVDSGLMAYSIKDVKNNSLVAVARWDSYQKDFPLLLGAALDFMRRYPNWTFDIVGKGVARYQHLLDRVDPNLLGRINIHGPLSYEETSRINRRAKIHFIASRWEGFCNASVEALCCGCSYVGPINIAASSYLIESHSGTIAPRRHRADLADALCAEAEAWNAGRRDPVAISADWISKCGFMEVTQKTLNLLESIPDRG